jgi:hypothetical protein
MFRTFGQPAIAVLVLTYSAMPVRRRPRSVQPRHPAQYTPPLMSSALHSHDMVTHDVGAIGLQAFADILAWQTFIALNCRFPDQRASRSAEHHHGFVTKGGEGGGGRRCPGLTVWERPKRHRRHLSEPSGAADTV